MQVDIPGQGSGEPHGSPHSPPKTRLAMLMTDKITAALAAYPPCHRDVKPGAVLTAAFITLTRHNEHVKVDS